MAVWFSSDLGSENKIKTYKNNIYILSYSRLFFYTSITSYKNEIILIFYILQYTIISIKAAIF